MRKIMALICLLSVLALLPTVGCGNGASEPAVPNLKKVSEFEGGRLYEADKIHVAQLNGDYKEMGRQYGELLKPQINDFYKKAIVENFPSGPGISREEIVAFAGENFDKYPSRIKEVFDGMAETSGIGVDKLMLLDQYVLLSVLPVFAGHCSVLAAWGEYTGGGPLVFAKNEDFDLLFKEFDPDLVVVVYNPDDGSQSVASVVNAGQVGTMNEMSKEGLVLAMNQAPNLEKMDLAANRVPIFINYLSFFLDSTNMKALDAEFQSYRPPAPFIANVADTQTAYSFECSQSTCVRREAQENGLMAATNDYIDPSWVYPEGALESEGFKESATRRNNLLALGEKNKGKIDAKVMMEIMDTPKSQGGATVSDTIFQFVAVPAELKMWVKAPGYQDWVEVDVGELFSLSE